MFKLAQVADPISGASLIRKWRCGRIVMQGGKLLYIQHRLMCGSASMAQVWWQAKYGRSNDQICWLDYHQPFGMSGFLTLDYVRSGQQAGFKTFIGACHVLHEVARIRGAHAIVAHVSNGNISDRFLERMGWEQHMQKWSGRHWIRRFYDGYPASTLHRYVSGIARPSSSVENNSTAVVECAAAVRPVGMGVEYSPTCVTSGGSTECGV